VAVASPVRALLAAHLQAAWNQAARELGKSGRLAMAAASGLLALVLGVLVLGGGTVLGLSLGAELRQPSVALVLGGTLVGIALLGGVVGGLLGGSRVLAWEAMKVYPLRLRSLFGAELLAGAGDPFPMLTIPLAGAVLLGVGLVQPRTFPLLPLVWAGTALSQLCIQHLVGSLAARFVKRLRAGLLLLGFVGLLGPVLVSTQAGPADRSGNSVAGARTASARRIGARVARAAVFLPPLQAALGLGDAVNGRWGRAVARQLYPAACVGLLLVVAARTLRRDADPRALRAPSRGRERLWTFSSPAGGVARLHWESLISSHPGRLGFLMPLLAFVLVKGALSSFLGESRPWSIAGALAYLALTTAHLQLNQFGLDGPGVKALFLLPLRAEDLLRGKLAGFAVYQAVQALLLLLLLSASVRRSPLHAAAGLLLAACVSVAMTGLGHWTSAWIPRPLPRDSFRNARQAPLVGWVGTAGSILAVVLFGGLYALCAWRAPAALLPAMAAALGLTLFAYGKLVLPLAAKYLDGRREVLVQALG